MGPFQESHPCLTEKLLLASEPARLERVRAETQGEKRLLCLWIRNSFSWLDTYSPTPRGGESWEAAELGLGWIFPFT